MRLRAPCACVCCVCRVYACAPCACASYATFYTNVARGVFMVFRAAVGRRGVEVAPSPTPSKHHKTTPKNAHSTPYFALYSDVRSTPGITQNSAYYDPAGSIKTASYVIGFLNLCKNNNNQSLEYAEKKFFKIFCNCCSATPMTIDKF